jgi:hypothetical protein
MPVATNLPTIATWRRFVVSPIASKPATDDRFQTAQWTDYFSLDGFRERFFVS